MICVYAYVYMFTISSGLQAKPVYSVVISICWFIQNVFPLQSS